MQNYGLENNVGTDGMRYLIMERPTSLGLRR